MSGMHRDRVETKDRPGLHERFRLLIQLASAALVNGYAAGFAGCKIFTGTSKMVCLPVLNCYSCPGALGACPIGSLQAVEGGAKHNISFPRHFDAVWCIIRKAHLRISVPLRTGAGSAWQDSGKKAACARKDR